MYVVDNSGLKLSRREQRVGSLLAHLAEISENKLYTSGSTKDESLSAKQLHLLGFISYVLTNISDVQEIR